MDQARKHAIALLALLAEMKRRGIHLDPNLHIQLAQIAAATGVPYLEALAFARKMILVMIPSLIVEADDGIAISQERMGELAYLFLRYKASTAEFGIRLDEKFRREIGDRAKSMGISFEEALGFVRGMIHEVTDIVFVTQREKDVRDQRNMVRTSDILTEIRQ